MLLKDFYTIKSLEQKEGQNYTAHIVINKDHEVFKGHFPGNPVTPGVCMMQIIKEVSQEIAGSSLLLKSASNIKFMSLINPEVNPELKLELELNTTDDALIKVKNTTYFDETVALKLSCIYSRN